MSSPLPDIDSAARVLAVLGATDADPQLGDGWWLSDFLFLNHLLHSMGIEQTWLTSIDASQAYNTYGPYIHGRPGLEYGRKYVYDGTPGLQPRHTTTVHHLSIKQRFLEELRRMISITQPQQRLLVILIGHGDDDEEFSLCVGDDKEDQGWNRIKRSDVDHLMTEARQGVSLCVVNSACFSGGWLISESSRSVMAAALRDQECDAFSRSMSLTIRGSHFVNAVAQVFFAQNNAVNHGAMQMTGITQEDFRARYDRLPGAPTTELGPMDSPVTGSRRSTGYLEIMLHAYEALRPGHGTNDVAVDGRIARLRSPNVIFSDADAQWLLAALQHRLLLAAEASLVMVHAKLLPFRRLDEYDHSTWATNDSALTEQRARMMTVVKRFPLLLPANAPAYIAQYRVWRKPNQWFSAAAASKGLDQLELHRRLATVQRYRFSGEDAPSSSY